MYSAYEMVKKFSLKESNFIKTLCEPLQRIFGVKIFFYYSCTTAQNGFFSVGNMPEVQEFFYANEIYRNSPFFHHPKFIEPGIYDYRCIKNFKLQESLKTCADSVGINIGICFVEKKGNDLLRFGYSTGSSNGLEFIMKLMNCREMLEEFNKSFHLKVQRIIKSHSSYMLDLSKDLGEDYNQPPHGLLYTPTFQDQAHILDGIGSHHLIDADELSPQESACMQALLLGLSYKGIGDRLKKKTKTVENYMNSVKFKLGLNTKAELFAYAQLLEKCGFFKSDLHL